ncbi:CAP domain-containing protein [Pseudooceanicola onchidii]|uniref:CAP domain-containing protein n=1 Tax=Pseudooceanicola onchidii TaxID=2562279 RepID=UPI0010AA3CDA|nr:CAP domain-containing protein [Pseudooceanicola onchidii]
MGSPTAYEQLTMELVNRFRMDPTNEYDRLVGVDGDIDNAISYFGVDLAALDTQLASLSALSPLAWNSLLNDSATTHSERMIRLDEQAHNFEGEPDTRGKFDAAGYPDNSYIAENIFAFSDDALYGHAGFVIDWGYDAVDYTNGQLNANWQTTGDGIQDPAGHRNVIMSANYTEIGVGVVVDSDPGTSVGPNVTTQHFGGRLDYVAQFLGVVIDDQDSDNFYDIGEGMGGVTVTLTGNAGTFSTTTWDAGGWQIEVPADTYEIVFSGGGLAGTVTKTATLGTENVKVDALAQEALNALPQLVVPDDTVRITEYPWVQLNTVMSFSDADGNTATQYELRDTTGINNWYADGALRDATSGYVTTNLSGIWYRRDSESSVQTMEVRAHDGFEWGEWTAFTLTTDAVNSKPVVSVDDQSIVLSDYRWLKLSDVINVSDADGDAITKYEIYDSVGGHSWYADGKVVDAYKGYVTSNLNGIWMQRDDVASSQKLWVRAHDGASWSDWDSFTLTSAENSAPVVAVEDLTIQLEAYQWVQLNTILNTTDADGQDITAVRLYDTTGASNWFADGAIRDTSSGYTTSNIDGVWIKRDAVASTQTLGIEVSDGTDWSAMDTFDLITKANSKPVVTIADQAIGLNEYAWVRLNTVMNVTDEDGDVITNYEVYDSAGSNNWWADGGVVNAKTGYQTSDLDGIWFQRDGSVSDQVLWVRAHDGIAWGAWDSFNLSTYDDSIV